MSGSHVPLSLGSQLHCRNSLKKPKPRLGCNHMVDRGCTAWVQPARVHSHCVACSPVGSKDKEASRRWRQLRSTACLIHEHFVLTSVSARHNMRPQEKMKQNRTLLHVLWRWQRLIQITAAWCHPGPVVIKQHDWHFRCIWEDGGRKRRPGPLPCPVLHLRVV